MARPRKYQEKSKAISCRVPEKVRAEIAQEAHDLQCSISDVVAATLRRCRPDWTWGELTVIIDDQSSTTSSEPGKYVTQQDDS